MLLVRSSQCSCCCNVSSAVDVPQGTTAATGMHSQLLQGAAQGLLLPPPFHSDVTVHILLFLHTGLLATAEAGAAGRVGGGRGVVQRGRVHGRQGLEGTRVEEALY